MKSLRHTPAQALESCRTVTASTLSTFMTSRPIWLLHSREVQKAGVKLARWWLPEPSASREQIALPFV